MTIKHNSFYPAQLSRIRQFYLAISLIVLCFGLFNSLPTQAKLKLQYDPLIKLESEQSLPVSLQAKRITGTQNRGWLLLGEAELRQATRLLRADLIDYDEIRQELTAQGHVRLATEGSVLNASAARVRFANNSGELQNPSFFIRNTQLRGRANEAEFKSSSYLKLKSVAYTNCPDDNDDWLIRAARLDLDYQAQTGSAVFPILYFKDVPIFALPYIEFPLGRERRSGFLTPTLGTHSELGKYYVTPYYWNIAPNQDLTFTPRSMSKKGWLFENDYRYLGSTWFGTFRHQFARDDTTKKTSRYFYTQHQQSLLENGLLYWDYQKVSEPSYLSQWSLNQTDAAQSSLKQEVGFQYTTDLTKSMVRTLQYQTLTINGSAQIPSYSRKAQVAFEFQKLNYKDLDIFFDVDYNQFRHPTYTEGDRTATKLALSYYGMRKTWGFITPTLKLNRNYYQIYSRDSSAITAHKQLEVPQFILDTGLFFDKEFSFFDNSLRQSIEPRLVYQYTPYRQQNDIRSFDSAKLDLSFASIFTDNLYSGRDRFVNAKQLTFGVQSRLFDQYDGGELLRVALARRFYYAPQLVSLNDETVRKGTSSDYFGALSLNIASKWQADAAVQYSASLEQFQKTNWSLRWKPESFKTIALSYRSDKDITNPTQQVELGAQWKLANRWVPVMRIISDLKNNRNLERLIGIEYRSNCWVLRVAYQTYPKYDGSEGINRTFFIQLSLDGLGSLGKSPLTEFKKGVLGYQPLEAVRSLPRQGLWYEN